MSTAASSGYAGLIYGIGGALSSGIGAYYQSRAQRHALEMQASVDELNSEVAQLQAEEILYGSRRDATRVRAGGMRARSKATAVAAASGADIRSGSIWSILGESDFLSEDDAAEVRARGNRAAAGVRISAIQRQANAAIGRAGADSYNPGLSALSTFGAQGGLVAQRWYQFKDRNTDTRAPYGWQYGDQ